ncbi:hypothetical protein [Oceanisphaera avium]|uniref:OSBS enolase-like N-terminal domain-containing protein n=1 Tax=Oceanisphaera avium TaxID=1903694 RepID=A0A1Y0D0A2_9GAMM|nr:hypothetical protein [Oceanisphaera avium]ART80536.1 hypothetical protein CBP12_10620 [Oceanisphaera avium]
MSISLYPYQLSLTQPLVFAQQMIGQRQGFFVQINDAWGEIAPPLTADMALVAKDARQACARLRQGLAHNAHTPAVQFGLDCALAQLPSAPFSLKTSPLNLPLLEGARDPLVRAWRCRRIHPALAWLTLTGSIHYDAGLIRELCLLAPKVRLVLDGAGQFSDEYIQDLWSRIDGQRIDWIMDAGTTLAQAQGLAEQANIPVALDIARYLDTPPPQQVDLGAFSFASALLIRPSQLGGLAYNQALVRHAQQLGQAVLLGDSLQSGFGQSQLAYLSGQWLGEAPLALGRCRYLLDSGVDHHGLPLISGLTPL